MRRLAAFLLLFLAACDSLGRSFGDEVAWANSPDARTHAILLETNGGATTPYGYLIELHPAAHRGETPVRAGKLVDAARNDCSSGVDLHWLNPTTLALRFYSAKRVELPRSVVVGGRQIRIVAQAGFKNDDAPCGGMLASKGYSDRS